MLKVHLLIGLLAALAGEVRGAETLPPLTDGMAPQTYAELWAGYDPTAEPLEVEILKEWEEDGVVLRVLRYRIGIFKGQRSTMAAVYGFPKGGSKLPGLVQVHGGGQAADYRAPLTNAKRGYATISLAWAGRISAPGYSVGSKEVALFWEGRTDEATYRLTTDWGALDAYHAPSRNPKNNFQTVAPAAWTLDAVESPRNNPWFLCTLAARRALTFLATQPEVDAEKLGVYGHSMGGKLTVMTAAADLRVKAAAPSCGGISNRPTDKPLYRAALNDEQSLQRITCPIIFLSPANDFHGRIDDLQTALGEIASPDWRVTCSPHHNHQDTAEYQVAGPLWFDQHLKGTFSFPETPTVILDLKSDDGIPTFSVRPDAARPNLSVDIYYTQQGQMDGEMNDRDNTVSRFWHRASATVNGVQWTAKLPLLTTGKPLWVYANVQYALESPVTGAGYYYRLYDAERFNLSSRMLVATPAQLQAAGVKATVTPSKVIETFEDGWQKEWFSYESTDSWPRRTHKIYDEKWHAPAGASLAFEVRATQSNMLIVGIDEYAAEVAVRGNSQWQPVTLAPSDFHNAIGDPMPAWEGISELRLAAQDRLSLRVKGEVVRRELGAEWRGPNPEFRNLRWDAP